MSDRLLEAKEVTELPVGAGRLGAGAHAVGCDPGVELGRYHRYDRAEVLAWVESLKRGDGPTFRRHQPIGRVPG